MIKLMEYNKYNIVIVGLGGTGSNLLSPLSRMLSFSDRRTNVVIVDGDIYERKNKKNQNIGKSQLGISKSKAMCKLVEKNYPEVNISYVDEYVTDKNKLMKVFKKNETNILVSCVDNNSVRNIFNDIFNEAEGEFIYIDSGNGSEERVGQVVTGYKDKQGEVIMKPVADFFPEILTANDGVDKETSCEERAKEAPQNIATNHMAASLLFNVLNNIINFNYIPSNAIFFNCESCSVVSR